MRYIDYFYCAIIFQLLTLPLSIFAMKSCSTITGIKKPRFITFPHNNIIAVANTTTCMLTNLVNQESSILLDNDIIHHITKHPNKPMIAISTEKEVALYDVLEQTKKWSSAPLHKYASTAFNSKTERLFAYHKGILTLYDTTNNTDPIRYNIPFDKEDIGDIFCPISYNHARNELTYLTTAISLSCINCENFTTIKTNYIEHKDLIILGTHSCNFQGDIIAVQCLVMGCYLYPQTQPKTLKLFRQPTHIMIGSRGIAFHPYRNILAVLDDCMTITYIHTLSHKKIAVTHPYTRWHHIVRSEKPEENYQIDFSPDGKKLAIRDFCLIFDVPHNSIVTIYRVLRDTIQDNKIIRYIFLKYAQSLCHHYRLKQLSLGQLSQS